MRWFQCYRKGASTYNIDGFANRYRGEMLRDAGFCAVSEKFFECYLDEEAAKDPRGKAIAILVKENMFGLLDAVTIAMQERGQWDQLGVSSSELTQLKEDAKEDVIKYSASREYYWNL